MQFSKLFCFTCFTTRWHHFFTVCLTLWNNGALCFALLHVYLSYCKTMKGPLTPLRRRPSLKTERVNFKPPPTPPTFPIWKPPLYRERKALFRSDGVLQSAPVILHPTQTGQSATNTVRRRRVSASDFRRGTIRKGELLRQSPPEKRSAISSRVRIEQWQVLRALARCFLPHLAPAPVGDCARMNWAQKKYPSISTLV